MFFQELANKEVTRIEIGVNNGTEEKGVIELVSEEFIVVAPTPDSGTMTVVPYASISFVRPVAPPVRRNEVITLLAGIGES
jgi:hypothetical protein